MPFLPPNQQRQSTEGLVCRNNEKKKNVRVFTVEPLSLCGASKSGVYLRLCHGSSPPRQDGPSLLFRVRCEDQRAMADIRDGVLGDGESSLLPASYGVCGSAVSSPPSGVWHGSPAANKFSCILEVVDGLSWNLLGAKLGGGHGPIASPPH